MSEEANNEIINNDTEAGLLDPYIDFTAEQFFAVCADYMDAIKDLKKTIFKLQKEGFKEAMSKAKSNFDSAKNAVADTISGISDVFKNDSSSNKNEQKDVSDNSSESSSKNTSNDTASSENSVNNSSESNISDNGSDSKSSEETKPRKTTEEKINNVADAIADTNAAKNSLKSAIKTKISPGGNDRNTVTLEQNLETLQHMTALGVSMISGHKCSECGKPLKFIPTDGYCSYQCAVKAMTRLIFAPLTNYSIQGETADSLIEALKNTVDFINLLVNMVSTLPGMIAHIGKIPEKYKSYLVAKLSIAFITIKIIMNDILIKKNEYIIMLLTRVMNGVIAEKVAAAFAWLDAYNQTLAALKQAFATAYGVAMQIISGMSSMIGLPGESYGFMCTPKSIMYTFGPSSLFVPIPMVSNVDFSGLINVDYDTISKFIEKTFPPIQNIEYFMPPEAFAVRMLFSDQSVKLIQPIIETLKKIMTLGAEYLPKYQDLSPINPQFMIALITGWGPVSKCMFGLLPPFALSASGAAEPGMAASLNVQANPNITRNIKLASKLASMG